MVHVNSAASEVIINKNNKVRTFVFTQRLNKISVVVAVVLFLGGSFLLHRM